MITRTHMQGGVASAATYSDCERYRVRLQRIWDADNPTVTFIMLNPSTASELRNDPTIERCERRARMLGFGGFIVSNIFAWRATDPKNLRAASDPDGAGNTQTIMQSASDSSLIIAAWGTHGAQLGRGPDVARSLAAAGHEMHHLGLSKAGHPRHPLYVSYTVSPQIWHDPYPT